MYVHAFLWGIAVTLVVFTVALMIAEAALKRKIREMEKERSDEE